MGGHETSQQIHVPVIGDFLSREFHRLFHLDRRDRGSWKRNSLVVVHRTDSLRRQGGSSWTDRNVVIPVQSGLSLTPTWVSAAIHHVDHSDPFGPSIDGGAFARVHQIETSGFFRLARRPRGISRRAILCYEDTDQITRDHSTLR